MEWLKQNAGTVITLIVLIFGMVGTWVLYGADIKQLKKDRDETKEDVKELERTVNGHVKDSTVHIDPHRDEKRFDDFKQEIFRRFDETNRKMDQVLLFIPTPPTKG